jgi:rhodanese-related sulfurtransferase
MSAPTRRFHLPSALRASDVRIAPETARELIGAGALVLDVRRHDDRGRPAPGALRVPPDEIPGRVPEFPRDRPIVLACT